MSLLWDGNGFQYTPRDAFARKKFVGGIQNVAWQAGNLREEKGFFTTDVALCFAAPLAHQSP
jgi:hypothetical protein